MKMGNGAIRPESAADRPPKRKPIDRVVGQLDHLSTVNIERQQPTTLLVPLGATEQHGPHLPLGTDTFIAHRWATAVAGLLPEAVVAPPLPFGSSGEHQAFPGTLSIGHAALSLVLIELTRSAGHWADRVVFLSGHAGNLEPVRAATDQLRIEGHDVYYFVPAWSVDLGFTVDAHAGRTETSLMLHLEPDQVGADLVAGQTAPLSELLEEMKRAGVAAVSPSGVLGDPSAASSGEGLDLFQTLVASTVATIERL